PSAVCALAWSCLPPGQEFAEARRSGSVPDSDGDGSLWRGNGDGGTSYANCACRASDCAQLRCVLIHGSAGYFGCCCGGGWTCGGCGRRSSGATCGMAGARDRRGVHGMCRCDVSACAACGTYYLHEPGSGGGYGCAAACAGCGVSNLRRHSDDF